MGLFPRTEVGGLSLPRLVIGTNWFLGYSHTSAAKNRLIRERMDRRRIAEVLCAFLEYGIDAVLGPPQELLFQAVAEAQDRSGRPLTMLLTPAWRLSEEDGELPEPEEAVEACRRAGAAFCLPHACTTDALLDKMQRRIRRLEEFTRLIRAHGMIPGLSTHAPETVLYADRAGADVATYLQLYNACGFLMHVEPDWVRRVIVGARHPVIVIKPLAAGRLIPPVGLSFVWSTIRPRDLVCVGTFSPDEAREDAELSLALLEGRGPETELQQSRSKRSLS